MQLNHEMEQELSTTCANWMLREDHTGKPRHLKKEIPFPGDICSHCNPITHETKILTHKMIVGWYCLECHDVLDGNIIDSQAEDIILSYKENLAMIPRLINSIEWCKKINMDYKHFEEELHKNEEYNKSCYVFSIDSNKECQNLTKLRRCGRSRNEKTCNCAKVR